MNQAKTFAARGPGRPPGSSRAGAFTAKPVAKRKWHEEVEEDQEEQSGEEEREETAGEEEGEEEVEDVVRKAKQSLASVGKEVRSDRSKIALGEEESEEEQPDSSDRNVAVQTKGVTIYVSPSELQQIGLITLRAGLAKLGLSVSEDE
jgi:hypothetical protein